MGSGISSLESSRCARQIHKKEFEILTPFMIFKSSELLNFNGFIKDMISPYCDEHVMKLVAPIVKDDCKKFIFAPCSAKIVVERIVLYRDTLFKTPNNILYVVSFADDLMTPEHAWNTETQQWERYSGPPLSLAGKEFNNFGSDDGFFHQLGNTKSSLKHFVDFDTACNPQRLREIN
jgi:hypothetical protein